jgi:hypothetical protein
VSVDVLDYASRANAVLGIRDSGKTVTAKGFAEHLMDAGIPIVAFDPTGVWRFLREPGKHEGGKGYPVVIIGGKDANFPLADYEKVVRAALKQGVSVVIDLSGRECTKADWKRVVTGGIKLLMDENEGLRHVFIEEAAEFAPQIVRGSGAVVYAEVEKLVRVGGNSRLGVTLINQRSQELNKAVLELCDNLFLHRQKGNHALTYLRGWFENAEVEPEKIEEIKNSKIAKLPTGKLWVWLREHDPVLTKAPLCHSHHPDRRQLSGEMKLTAKAVDVEAFVSGLKAALAKVGGVAKTPVSNLGKVSVVSAGTVVVSADEIRRVVSAAVDAERATMAASLQALSRVTTETVERLGHAMDDFRTAMITARKQIETEFKKAMAGSQGHSGPRRPAMEAKASSNGSGLATGEASKPVAPPSPQDDGLKGPERELLRALRWWHDRGFSEPTRPQICAIAGWRVTSGHIKNVCGACRTKNLISYPSDGHVSLTHEGYKLAPAAPEQGLIASLRGIMTGPQATIFENLLADGEAGSNEELAQRVGWEPTSGHVKNVLGSLRSLEVVRKRAPIGLEPWVLQQNLS